MNVPFQFRFAVGVVLLCTLAAQGRAHGLEMSGRETTPQLRMDLLRMPPNETGLTLTTLFEEKLWIAITHPLRSETLDEIAGSVHRVPPRGVQFQLLTPGVAGITVHFRW